MLKVGCQRHSDISQGVGSKWGREDQARDTDQRQRQTLYPLIGCHFSDEQIKAHEKWCHTGPMKWVSSSIFMISI